MSVSEMRVISRSYVEFEKHQVRVTPLAAMYSAPSNCAFLNAHDRQSHTILGPIADQSMANATSSISQQKPRKRQACGAQEGGRRKLNTVYAAAYLSANALPSIRAKVTDRPQQLPVDRLGYVPA